MRIRDLGVQVVRPLAVISLASIFAACGGDDPGTATSSTGSSSTGPTTTDGSGSTTSPSSSSTTSEPQEPQTTPVITVDPTCADVNEQFVLEVSGKDFDPRVRVSVSFFAGNFSVFAQPTTDDAGGFDNVDLIITEGQPPGRYQVSAVQPDDDQRRATALVRIPC